GVGEATIPNINHILAVIGLDELDFMKAVDGTFKQSIRYNNWLHNKGEYYHHPFSRTRITPIDHSGRRWLQSDRSVPFMDTVSAQPLLCELNLSPKTIGPWDFGPPFTYAFHMNAQKFADYLRDHSTARGVTHTLDHVTDVEMKENGNIGAIHTKSGSKLEADLFIDSTGFAAVLIEKALGVPFVDCSQWLLCDQAITMHVPYEQHYLGYVRPYTSASALNSGWVWDIPMQDKRSLGYVHASDFVNAENAERELKAFEGVHARNIDARLVKFKVGHRAQPWKKNCVSIGLAGSFIEPLESTGLYLSHLAAVMLAEHYPYMGDTETMAFRFNRIMTNRFYEVLDFINMHYCLTRREDTEFWREIRRPERLHDRLKAKLEYWRVKPPSASDFQDQYLPMQTADMAFMPSSGDERPPVDTAGLWNHESYEAILYGMDFLRDEYRAWFGPNLPRTRMHSYVVDRIKQAPSKLPTHAEWLQRVLGMPKYRTTV
ncbi:MAG: tryptophan halogenase family protein, partial [Pseudomonadota bacterium]